MNFHILRHSRSCCHSHRSHPKWRLCTVDSQNRNKSGLLQLCMVPTWRFVNNYSCWRSGKLLHNLPMSGNCCRLARSLPTRKLDIAELQYRSRNVWMKLCMVRLSALHNMVQLLRRRCFGTLRALKSYCHLVHNHPRRKIGTVALQNWSKSEEKQLCMVQLSAHHRMDYFWRGKFFDILQWSQNCFRLVGSHPTRTVHIAVSRNWKSNEGKQLCMGRPSFFASTGLV